MIHSNYRFLTIMILAILFCVGIYVKDNVHMPKYSRRQFVRLDPKAIELGKKAEGNPSDHYFVPIGRVVDDPEKWAWKKLPMYEIKILKCEVKYNFCSYTRLYFREGLIQRRLTVNDFKSKDEIEKLERTLSMF